MVGHVSVLEQVDADFSGARRRALLRRMAARLRGNTASGGLLCFDDARKASGPMAWIQRGARTVPMGQVCGGVGRCSEFDRTFMLLKATRRIGGSGWTGLSGKARSYPPSASTRSAVPTSFSMATTASR